jgi:hypothetical protein
MLLENGGEKMLLNQPLKIMETLYSIFIILVIISVILGSGFILALVLEQYPNSWLGKLINKERSAESENESDL